MLAGLVQSSFVSESLFAIASLILSNGSHNGLSAQHRRLEMEKLTIDPATGKSMTPVSGEVIPPATLSLSELVASVNNEHRQVKECVIKGAQHAVRAGELLWQAKRKARHGRWLEWIAENCEFSERTAELYMKLARDLPQVANSQGIADLSLTGAIKMIEELKSPEENPIPKGRSKKTDKLAEAIKNDALAILERAWGAASENEQSIFLKKIVGQR